MVIESESSGESFNPNENDDEEQEGNLPDNYLEDTPE